MNNPVKGDKWMRCVICDTWHEVARSVWKCPECDAGMVNGGPYYEASRARYGRTKGKSLKGKMK